MTVYVDDAMIPFGRMKMCHLWADTEPELLRMVDTIGVARKWIQGHPTLSFGKYKEASWVHFDISKDKQRLAIQNGAKLTDIFGPVEHTARLALAKAKIAKDDEAAERARQMLRNVVDCRARRQTQGELEL